MKSDRLFVAFSLILTMVGSCWWLGSIDKVSRSLITAVLSKAKVSGSISYWGRCGYRDVLPDLPNARAPREKLGSVSPVQALREMFADNPKMQVTEDANGVIRMVESGVPRDLLDVRISHISFKDPRGRDGIWIPRQARRLIVSAPEIRAFMRDNGINWPSEGEYINDIYGGPDPSRPHVTGDLYDVTLADAMDYVSKTFPGFWVYENCRRENGTRVVFFEIFGSIRKQLTSLSN